MEREQVVQIVERLTATYRSELDNLRQTLQGLTENNTITEYTDQTYDRRVACDLDLQVIKSIPEFDGDSNRYVAWRQSVSNAIKPFLDYPNSLKLYQAICMIRNKVVKSADNLLASHGTPLNFTAIVARLDFAYSDKRPIHVIEQELSVLRQGRDTILDYYNKVNQKLTLLTNKNIMTYGDGSSETKIHNLRARENALRVFITGLNAPLSNIIFSLNPTDLPTALARTQELISNQERYNFAMSHEIRQNQLIQTYANATTVRPFFNTIRQQPNIPQNQFQNIQQNSPVEPMDIDPTFSRIRQPNQFQNNHRNNSFSGFKQNNAFSNNNR